MPSPKVPHKLTKHVKLLHKVALTYNNEVLLLQRSEQEASRPLKWDLAGGNSEWPEATVPSGPDYHTEDVVREIREETGIALDSHLVSFDALVYLRSYYEAEVQVYTMICGWTFRLPSKPSIQLSDEHVDFAWATKESLKDFDYGKVDFIAEIAEAGLAKNKENDVKICS